MTNTCSSKQALPDSREQMAPATPLPWKISGTSWLCNAGGGVICYLGNALAKDAVYVNTACNAYPALLQRIKELEEGLTEAVAVIAHANTHGMTPTVCSFIDRARSLLPES